MLIVARPVCEIRPVVMIVLAAAPSVVLPETVKFVLIVARPVCASRPDVVGLLFVAYKVAALDTCNLSAINVRSAVFVDVKLVLTLLIARLVLASAARSIALV